MRRSMVGLLAAVGTALSTLGALALRGGVLVIFAVVAAAAAGLAAYLSLSPVAASTPAEPLPTLPGHIKKSLHVDDRRVQDHPSSQHRLML